MPANSRFKNILTKKQVSNGLIRVTTRKNSLELNQRKARQQVDQRLIQDLRPTIYLQSIQDLKMRSQH